MTGYGRRLRRSLVPILALAGGLFLALQPLFVTGFAAVPGGPGDTRLVHFSLEHAHRFLMRQEPHLDLWDPPIFYPARNVGAYTDVLLSLTPFYTPWRLLGAAPDTAFQLWLIVVWALNFVAFQLFLTRGLRLDPVAFAAGAYLFAFGSPRVANVVHSQLIPGFYLVLALYALFRVTELDGTDAGTTSRRRRWIVVFFLALVLQLYGAFYPVFFFAFVCGLGVVLGLLWRPSCRRLFQLLRSDAPVLAGAGLLAAALAAPLVERYLVTARLLGLRSWAATEPRMPRWQSWLLMGHDNWLYGWLYGSDLWPNTEVSRSSAHASGIGLVAMVCAIAGFWRYRHRISTRLLIGVSLLVVLLTTVWPGGWTPWRAVYEVLPGAGAIRALGRIGMLLLIPAAIGVAYFFQRQLKPRGAVLAAVLAALMAFEQGSHVASYDKRRARLQVQMIRDGLDSDCRAFYAYSGNVSVRRRIEEDAMWAALETGVPSINGRYGNNPPGWSLRPSRRDRSVVDRPRIEAAFEAWLSHNCLDPAEVCWLEAGTGVVPATRTSRRVASCSASGPS